GLERKLLEQPRAEGVDGLDLEAARRLQRGGEQGPRASPLPGIDGGDADVAQGRIEGRIVERNPAAQPVIDPRRHIGGRRPGEGGAAAWGRVRRGRGGGPPPPSPPSSISRITRCASTWVLPEPALAATKAEHDGSDASACFRRTASGIWRGLTARPPRRRRRAT